MESGDVKKHTSSAVQSKPVSAWEHAHKNHWYEPKFWLDLLVHPSPALTLNHQRRRARLYSLVSIIFFTLSLATNIVLAETGKSSSFVAVHAVVNVLIFVSYLLSRTENAQAGQSLGVFALWVLPFVNTIITLRSNPDQDVTVTDSVNWLFSPAWMLMAAIFLSRSMTVFFVGLDVISIFLLPAIGESSFHVIRSLMFYHMVSLALLLMASIVAFRDKLQLQSQADSQTHEDQHSAGRWSRFFLQPHNDITDRIFRRRSRMLSAFLLAFVPSTLIWLIVEATAWTAGTSDGVLIALAVGVCLSSIGLYFQSRSKHTRWASRLTLFMILLIPYIYYAAPTSTLESRKLVNLVSNTMAAILGVALFSGPELIALSAIIFFPTLYSPLFPPHVIMSVILLASAFIYRRDIQEIHDTALQHEVSPDEASDLMVPWEGRFIFGRVSYIQMVQAWYVVGFSMVLFLGIACISATVTNPKSDLVVVNSALASTTAEVDYWVFVHTLDCSSELPQSVTVLGKNSKMQYISPFPLETNTINRIGLTTSASLGPIDSISFTLGEGNYAILQNEDCDILRVDVWDVRNGKGYSTSALTEVDGTINGRGLLGRDREDDDDKKDKDPVCQREYVNNCLRARLLNPKSWFSSLKNRKENARQKAERMANEANEMCQWGHIKQCKAFQERTTACSFAWAQKFCPTTPGPQTASCPVLSDGAICSGAGNCTTFTEESGALTFCKCDPDDTDPLGQDVYTPSAMQNDLISACSVQYNDICGPAGLGGGLQANGSCRIQAGVIRAWKESCGPVDHLTGQIGTILRRGGAANSATYTARNPTSLPKAQTTGPLSNLGLGFVQFFLADLASAVANTANPTTGPLTNGRTAWIDADMIYSNSNFFNADETLNVAAARAALTSLPAQALNVIDLIAKYHNWFVTGLVTNNLISYTAGQKKDLARAATIIWLNAVAKRDLIEAFGAIGSSGYANTFNIATCPTAGFGKIPAASTVDLTATIVNANLVSGTCQITKDSFTGGYQFASKILSTEAAKITAFNKGATTENALKLPIFTTLAAKYAAGATNAACSSSTNVDFYNCVHDQPAAAGTDSGMPALALALTAGVIQNAVESSVLLNTLTDTSDLLILPQPLAGFFSSESSLSKSDNGFFGAAQNAGELKHFIYGALGRTINRNFGTYTIAFFNERSATVGADQPADGINGQNPLSSSFYQFAVDNGYLGPTDGIDNVFCS